MTSSLHTLQAAKPNSGALEWDMHTDDDGMTWWRVVFFRVYGESKAQPRPRAFAKSFGGKPTARMYTPGTAEAWKGDIARDARAHIPPQPFTGAIKLESVVLFQRPQRLLTKKSPDGRIPHTAKPDRDNLDKAIMDCLKTLGVFVDDAQVTDGEGVKKRYVARNEVPGAEITVYVLADESNPEMPAGKELF